MADLRCVQCRALIAPGDARMVGKASERNVLCPFCFSDYMAAKRGVGL